MTQKKKPSRCEKCALGVCGSVSHCAQRNRCADCSRKTACSVVLDQRRRAKNVRETALKLANKLRQRDIMNSLAAAHARIQELEAFPCTHELCFEVEPIQLQPHGMTNDDPSHNKVVQYPTLATLACLEQPRTADSQGQASSQ